MKGKKMIIPIFKLLLSGVIALLIGKLISKVKLPSILGWLIAGMIVGPHALKLINSDILDSGW